MTVIRLEMSWGSNLYRYSEERFHTGAPATIEHFNNDPEARKALGRWSPCPNINVAKRILAALGGEG